MKQKSSQCVCHLPEALQVMKSLMVLYLKMALKQFGAVRNNAGLFLPKVKNCQNQTEDFCVLKFHQHANSHTHLQVFVSLWGHRIWVQMFTSTFTFKILCFNTFITSLYFKFHTQTHFPDLSGSLTPNFLCRVTNAHKLDF